MAEVMKSANATIFRNKLVQLIIKKGIPNYMTKIGISRVFNNKEILTDEKIQRVNDFWNREGNIQHIIAMACSDTYLEENLIKKIACPTLIIWGKQDKIISAKYADRFHQDILGSQEIVYDSCGHVPMMERPVDSQRDVLNFFNK